MLTAAPLRRPIPGVPFLMSRFGEAIRERREFVGFKTATDCAAASQRLAIEEPTKYKKFSQSSLSRWELDRTGENIQSAHGKSLRTLAHLLKWSASEFEENVGIPIGNVPGYDDPRRSKMGDSEGMFTIPGGMVSVPVMGMANGGRPRDYGVLVDADFVHGDNTRAYKVSGSSMDDGSDKAIKDGEWVLADISLTDPVSGKIFLLEIIGDGMTVKRLKRQFGEWVFTSDNPECEESWREDEVRIVGLVYGGVAHKRF